MRVRLYMCRRRMHARGSLRLPESPPRFWGVHMIAIQCNGEIYTAWTHTVSPTHTHTQSTIHEYGSMYEYDLYVCVK